MMIEPMNELWKEAASREVDHAALEKSFLNQSYAAVNNRAEAMMQAPYSLGFEIVYKNDEATRMVGLYAFRVNNQLIYIPVFFVAGQIKPVNLLYRTNIKRFTGLTTELVEFLLEDDFSDTSNGLIDRTDTSKAHAPHNLHRISDPVQIKSASANPTRSDYYAAWDDMIKVACEPSDEESSLLLPLYLEATGSEGIEKLASLLEGNTTAQVWLVENYTKDQLLPENALQKEAAFNVVPKSVPTLRLVTDISQLSKSASHDDYDKVTRNGYVLEDDRDDTTRVFHVPSNPKEISQAGVAGIYDVLTKDGDSIRCLIAPTAKVGAGKDNVPSYLAEAGRSLGPELVNRSRYSHVVNSLIVLEGKYKGDYLDLTGNPFANLIDEPSKVQGTDVDRAVKGRYYVILDKDAGEVTKVFYVTDKEEDEGITTLTVKRHKKSYDSDTHQIRYKKGSRYNDLTKGLINENCCLLEVDNADTENEYEGLTWKAPLADESTIENWMYEAFDEEAVTKKASILRDRHGEYKIALGNGRIITESMDEMTCMVKLARDLRIHAKVVESMVDLVPGSQKDYVLEIPMAKSAFVTRIINGEDFQDGYDSELGFATTQPEVRVLETHTPQVDRRGSHIGDHVTPGNSVNPQSTKDAELQIIMSSSPDQLAELSTKTGNKSVLDHGLVGTLTQENFQLERAMEDYIPRVESGLDSQCRLLFLLFCKPEAFEKSFGDDDTADIEKELTDNISTQTKFLVRLLKRRKGM